MASTTTDDASHARRLRDYGVRTAVRLIAGALILFVILRIAAPWLISRHEDVALVAGALLLLLTPLVVIQLAYGLWTDWRRLRAA